MKTVSKLFGGNHCLHLTAFDEKQDILKQLYNQTKISLPEKTKATQLLSNQNILVLQKGYYAMGVPDDVEIYLYFTKYRGTNRCFLICRQLGPGYTQPKVLLLFPKCLNDVIYEGTLIEGVRVYATEKRFFILMTDVLWFKGEKVVSKSLIERLVHLGEFMQNDVKEDLRQMPFRLQIATPFVHLNLLEQRLNNLPYKVNRILFVPPHRTQKTLYYPIGRGPMIDI
tara:strand:+ start:253 stop:930 length:678 start_codon:yes stop_codon:yes gene_type:complete